LNVLVYLKLYMLCILRFAHAI